MWCSGLAKGDAEKITIPHILLASNGEDAEVVKQYKAIIEGDGKPGVVRILWRCHRLCFLPYTKQLT